MPCIPWPLPGPDSAAAAPLPPAESFDLLIEVMPSGSGKCSLRCSLCHGYCTQDHSRWARCRHAAVALCPQLKGLILPSPPHPPEHSWSQRTTSADVAIGADAILEHPLPHIQWDHLHQPPGRVCGVQRGRDQAVQRGQGGRHEPGEALLLLPPLLLGRAHCRLLPAATYPGGWAVLGPACAVCLCLLLVTDNCTHLPSKSFQPVYTAQVGTRAMRTCSMR